MAEVAGANVSELEVAEATGSGVVAFGTAAPWGVAIASGLLIVVAGGTKTEGATLPELFSALLMPARPASLIPATGVGVGRVAVGVVNIGPPNGPTVAGGWVDDWPCA